jgi:hypothetical protein
LAAYLLLIILMGPAGAHAVPQDLVREAQRLRDTGQFAAALKLLEERLVQAPDDAEAARLRAQTLYWLKDIERARQAYAGALARHPDDRRTRIEYARMLAETGERRTARALLEGPDLARDDAEAATLLGTILYWDGDLTGAKRLFLQALARGPAKAGPYDAARQLHEIQMLSAPWIKVSPAIWHDDQPLDSRRVGVEAGWFATPLLSLAARASPQHYSADGGRTFWTAEAELSHYASSARVATRLAAGMIRRPGEQLDVQWTTRASIEVQASRGFTIEGRFAREPYLHTTASLDRTLMTSTGAGVLKWHRSSRWVGEAAVQRQVFPDNNAVNTAYGWILAPVIDATARLQAGYAIAAADAREDRFALAHPQQQIPPSTPGFDFAGIYDPYFTPARVVSHSVIATLTVGKSGGPVFRTSGSYGFHAREDATSFSALANVIVSTVNRRAFTPWTARASLEIPASASTSFNVRVESGHTSYYQWNTGVLEMIHRFLPPSRSHAQHK